MPDLVVASADAPRPIEVAFPDQRRRVVVASSNPLLGAGLAALVNEPYLRSTAERQAARDSAEADLLVCTPDLALSCIRSRRALVPVAVVHTEPLVGLVCLSNRIYFLHYTTAHQSLAAFLSGRLAPSRWEGRTHVVNPVRGRQGVVLGLLARGASSGEIARDLGISVSTAKTYVTRLMDSMGCASSSELGALARLLELTR